MPQIDPLLAELQRRLGETLGDEGLKDRLNSIRNSRTWKRVEEFLALRREQLYMERPETTDALWKREGALAEIQKLLLHGPSLVLQWQQWQSGTDAIVSPPASPVSTPPPASKSDDGLG